MKNTYRKTTFCALVIVVALAVFYTTVFLEGCSHENNTVNTEYAPNKNGDATLTEDERVSDWVGDLEQSNNENSVIVRTSNDISTLINTTNAEVASGFGSDSFERTLAASEMTHEEILDGKDSGGVVLDGKDSGGIVSDGRFPDDIIILPDDISLPYPKPDAEYFVESFGTLYCVGMTERDFRAYKDELANAGWICVYDKSIESIYVKDNAILRITDQTHVPEPNHAEIRISYDAGHTDSVRVGAASNADAIEIIQRYISASLDEWLSSQSVKYALELDISDIYEKMGFQAFTAISGNGYGDLGTYLICNGTALPVSLGDTCVADIDKDGEYELISIYGSGSGIWRININAYKFGTPPGSGSPTGEVYRAYRNCWLPDEGFAELTVQCVNDTDVKLFSMARNSNGEYSLSTDYGLLRIEGNILRPSNNINFPFTEWGVEPANPIPDRAEKVSDGYLIYDHDIDKEEFGRTGERILRKCIEKYDLTYSLLWRREYPFMTDVGLSSQVTIAPAMDDSFVISYSTSTYQQRDGIWREFTPVVARCDRDGNLLWQRDYEGFSSTAFRNVFCLENGNVLTIGSNETKETKRVGTWSRTDVYISLITPDGRLIDEQYCGGNDYDELEDVCYIGGVGLVALIRTQSKDGTFAASKTGYPVDVLTLIDDNDLSIKWQMSFEGLIRQMRVADGIIYLEPIRSDDEIKVNFEGNILP